MRLIQPDAPDDRFTVPVMRADIAHRLMALGAWDNDTLGTEDLERIAQAGLRVFRRMLDMGYHSLDDLQRVGGSAASQRASELRRITGFGLETRNMGGGNFLRRLHYNLPLWTLHDLGVQEWAYGLRWGSKK